jgi:hypothetical protein
MGMKARPKNNVLWVSRDDQGGGEHSVEVWPKGEKPAFEEWCVWRSGKVESTYVCVREFRRLTGVNVCKGTAQQFEFNIKPVGEPVKGADLLKETKDE